MDPSTIALIILVIGAVLLIAEALSPGVFLVIPGAVLLILGVAGWIWPDFLISSMAPVVGVVIAVPVTAGTIVLYRRLGRPEPPSTTVADSLVGRAGTVVSATGPDSLKGKVRIGSDIWSARSDEPIEAGAEVVVVHAEGVHVKVERSGERLP